MRNLLIGLCATVALTIAGVALSKNANGPDLVTTFEDGNVYVDLVTNDQEIRGVQFDLNIEGVSPKAIDLQNCLSGLPAGFEASRCAIVKGAVRVLIFSISKDAVIPSGTVANIKLNSSKTYSLKKGNKGPAFTLSGVEMVGTKGTIKPGFVK